MPVNENLQFGTSVRWEQMFDESVSQMEAFSGEQLVAMNKVFIALLHIVSLPELLSSIHRALSDVAQVPACAHYVAMEGGHLRLDCGAGVFRECLPDIIPSGSDLLASIRSSDHARPISRTPLQPSLFGDTPVASFWAIDGNRECARAFACVHAVESEEFVTAVCRQVAIGLCRFSGALTLRLAQGSIADLSFEAEPVSRLNDRLTSREQELLDLLCRGFDNKGIASKLFISVATCKHHLENIFIKLGVHSRSAAVAVEHGLADPRSQGIDEQ